MTEREFCKQAGEFQQMLPDFWWWFRIPDDPRFGNTAGLDGFLFYDNKCWPVEFKKSQGKLTKREKITRDAFLKSGRAYIVIYIYELIEVRFKMHIYKPKGNDQIYANLTIEQLLKILKRQ